LKSRRSNEAVSEVKEETKPKRRWRWGWIALGLIALLIVGHAFWGWYQGAQLTREVEALRRKGEPMGLLDFKVEAVADGENAAVLLREAARSIDLGTDAWAEFDQLILEAMPLPKPQEIAAVEAVLKENEVAMRKLREARGRKRVDWKVEETEMKLFAQKPALDRLRELGALGGGAVLLAHARGDDREAIARVQDLLWMSEAVGQMPAGVIGQLTAASISARPVDRLQKIAPELRIGGSAGEVEPRELAAVISKLLDEKPVREAQKHGLRVQRAAQIAAARRLNTALPTSASNDKEVTLLGYLGRPMFLKDGRILAANTTAIMEAAEAENWMEFKRRAQASMDEMKKLRQSKLHLMAALLAGGDEFAARSMYREMTERRLAAVALAVRWYAVEHGGAMPKSLEELVPKYLQAVPADAMGEKRKIGYVAEESRPRIYSVGMNGTDEGGSDVPLRKNFQEAGRWEREDVVLELKRGAKAAPR
jgi:hypothetical protein